MLNLAHSFDKVQYFVLYLVYNSIKPDIYQVMKIVYLLGAAVLLGAGSMSAQSKFDARGKQLLDLYKSGELTIRDSQSFLAVPSGRGGEDLVDVMVETTDEAVLDSLDACGYTVEYISPSFSHVTMPAAGIETLAESPSVLTLSFGHSAEPAMDKARGASNVNTCHTGLRLPQKYRGEGVIVGMFDTGFDPSHINWLSQDGKTVRLKFFARFQGSSTTPTIYQGADIRKAPTDGADQTHGTHVAGIMGGAYNGAGRYPGGSNASTVNLYGVAPDADMAIAAGELYNNSILAGIRRLINYANSQQKPLVVNLSLGGSSGPHDGTDAFSRQLDELGREAIICVAAGNEGDARIHAGKTFTASDKELKVLLDRNKMNAGSIDVWGSTNAEIKVSVVLVRSNTGEIVAKISSENGKTVTCGSGEGNDHSIFRNAFDGNIVLTGLVSSNNRYNVSVSANGDVTPKNGTTEVLGLMFEGPEGVRVDAYGNDRRDIRFAAAVPTGFERGDNNGSISSMACGFNIIAVGSYGTRSQWNDLSGGSHGTGSGEGTLSSFSSWGELVDGRKLPHVCAPGGGINSSVSGPYIANHMSEEAITATATEGGTTHYWANMNGTSMATPYVTGAVALWLQADPTLKVDKVRRIMIDTAKKDTYVTDDIAWGAGKLQAVEGLRAVISEAGAVNDVSVAGDDIMIDTNGLSVKVFAAAAAGISAQLYTMSGVLAASANADGETLDIEAPAPGLYVLSVKSGATVKSVKIALN